MLAKHDVAGAVQSAVNKKQYKLASMLSNAGSSTVFKQILQQQLNDRVTFKTMPAFSACSPVSRYWKVGVARRLSPIICGTVLRPRPASPIP